MNSPQTRSSEVSVSIIENDLELRGNLIKIVGNLPGLRHVSLHTDAADALEKIPRFKPDVVLMDINLPGGSGIECLRTLKISSPRTQVIVFTACQESEEIINAIMAGASGYLFKPTPPDELLVAIRDVHEGGSPMDRLVMRIILQWLQRPAPIGVMKTLSPKETRVFELLSQGHLYREIAERLDISYATVHTHIRHIYRKLQVRSRTQAVAKGLREKIGEKAVFEKPFFQSTTTIAGNFQSSLQVPALTQ